jgi:WD40 repeat protein
MRLPRFLAGALALSFSCNGWAQPAPPATKPILELKQRNELKGHAAPIKALAISPDGTTIASGDATGVTILWDRTRLNEIRKLTGPAHVALISLSFSKDGNLLAAGSADGHVRVWETANGEMDRDLAISALTSARFSPDGSILVCTRGIIPEADEDRDLLHIYDAKALKKLGTIDVDLEYITDCSFSTDGTALAISGGESLTDVPADKGGKRRDRIEIWDFSPGSTSQPIKPDALAKLRITIGESARPLLSPAYSPGGRIVAAASGDWIAFETKTGKQIATLRAPRYEARCCAISPSSRWVATGAIDSTVALFDTREWEMRYQNQADPSQDVTAMVFSPEGATLIAARGTMVDLFVVPGR